MTRQLILKRAPIGPNLEDYDVYVVGRIFLSAKSLNRASDAWPRGRSHTLMAVDVNQSGPPTQWL
jgi:hypothetical protein